MNAFPYLAAFTILVSFAILQASFADLREAPLALDVTTTKEREATARHLIVASTLRPAPIDEANEGLLDHELASEDPINAWLDRYLTPPTQ